MSRSRFSFYRPAGLIIGTLAILTTASATSTTLATMATPTPGSQLTGSSVTFTWNAGTNVAQYYLYVGSVQGGNDLYGQNQNLGTSAMVTGLPTDGRTLFVRLWSLVNGAATDISVGWHFNDYQYLAQNTNATCGTPSPAQITTPAPNSVLPGAMVTFSWTGGSCVTQYTLSVGKTMGGSEFFGPTTMVTLSQTVSGLPTDGSQVFVRLSSTINGQPIFTDYNYTAFNNSGGCATPAAAQITSPVPGSTLTGATQVFAWSGGCGVTDYYLYVGSSLGSNDLYGQDQALNTATATAVTVPTDGRTLYVRLWSQFGGVFHFNDYTFKASGTGNGCANAAPAQIVTPVNGATLSGASQTFTWTAGSCATAYALLVGNSVGDNSIFNGSSQTALTVTVSNIPTDGRPLFVRLISFINAAPVNVDYTYLAATVNTSCGSPVAATIATPAPGAVLAGSSQTFTWNAGCNVTEYFLFVGTTAGGTDIYSQDQGVKLSATVPNLPLTGGNVFVRLWSLINTVWTFNDYTYKAFGSSAGCNASSPAIITSPTPSSVLTGTSVTFTWSTGSCVTSYTFSVGHSTGATDIFTTTGTATTATVSNLPSDGSMVFVTLSSLINGVPQVNSYTYTALSSNTGCGITTLAAIATPSPGSVLAGSTQTFTWSAGCNISMYFLWVGTASGASDIFGANVGTNLSAQVTGIPTNGAQIFVTLWSFVTVASNNFSTGWHSVQYVYSAAGSNAGCGTPTPAQVTSPAAGSTLTSGSVVFTWNTGTCATSYQLSVGTSQGAGNLFQSSQTVAFTVTATGLPTNGSTVFVRLTSFFSNASPQFVDTTYTAASSNSGCGSVGVPATILTPAPGSTLPGPVVTFTWTAGCNAGQYFIWIGTAVGANDIYNLTQGTNTSVTIPGLPTGGQTLFLRLWTFLNTAASDVTTGWHYNDYQFASAH